MKKKLLIYSGVGVGLILIAGSIAFFMLKGETSDQKITPAETTNEVTFPSGIYYREINTDSPEGVLSKIDGGLTTQIKMSPVGYDVRADKVVYGNENQLHLINPQGEEIKTLTLDGLFGVVRPSFSMDGNKIAVQASATPDPPYTDLNIYVVDIASGKYERVGNLSWNEESPRFFSSDNRLAYSSFSPSAGVNLHIFDFDTKKETAVFKDKGNLQIAVSKQGTEILNPFKLQIYDTSNGTIKTDLKEKVIASLKTAGYDLDSTNKGAQGQGSFPLDGSFSPDGKQIVLDGAVTKNGQLGVIIFQIDVDGSNFKVLKDLIQSNPDFSNKNNFSQINPLWI